MVAGPGSLPRSLQSPGCGLWPTATTAHTKYLATYARRACHACSVLPQDVEASDSVLPVTYPMLHNMVEPGGEPH